MSHADDGTLHAYLDGELSALEAVRLEAHLSECADCRRRLADERGLVTRAGELLAAAVPPERAAPPLHQLRRPRPGRRARFPLAWAATLVLTVAVAWFVRLPHQPGPRTRLQRAERSIPANPPRPDSAAPAEEKPSLDRDEAAPARLTPTVQTPPPAPPRLGEVRAPDAMGDLAAARPGAPPGASVATLDTASRGNAAVASRSAAPARSQSQDLSASPQPYPGTISLADARTLLGTDPVAVPGLRVLSIRRARLLGYSPVVVVEQVVDSSVIITVVHRRPAVSLPAAGVSEGAAPALERRAETFADSLGGLPRGLEVDVVGPLPPDSLSRLRAALQPLIRR